MLDNFFNKKVVIFDLDMTLTKSKSPIEHEMAGLLGDLLKTKKVAVISGGAFLQFERQFLAHLSLSEEELRNLYILPTNGTTLLSYDGQWNVIYRHDLTETERDKIKKALSNIFEDAGVEKPTERFGKIVEDRGSQITLSALGQKAPLDKKSEWDPDLKKRKKMQKRLKEIIPEFDIQIGGSSSLDVLKMGVDKGYGVMELQKYLEIPIEDMLFVGDRLKEGGNDYPVIKTGIDVIAVSGVEDTKQKIREMI